MALDNIEYVRRLSLGLKHLRESGRFCDVILVTSDRLLHAHSIVLAAASPVFRSAFQSCASDGCMNYRLQLEGFNGLTIGTILDCIYCGCADPLTSLSPEQNVESVMDVCQALGVSWIFDVRDRKYDEHGLAHQLVPENIKNNGNCNGTSCMASEDIVSAPPRISCPDLNDSWTSAPSAAATEAEIPSKVDEHGVYVCDVCARQFSLGSDLRRHRHRHKHCATCDDCGHSFLSKDDLCQHSEIQCPRTTVTCNVCRQTFDGCLSLLVHTSTDHCSACVCTQCGQAFHAVDQLDAHTLMHTKKRIYRCQICHSCFRSPRRLRKHIHVHATNVGREEKVLSESEQNRVEENRLQEPEGHLNVLKNDRNEVNGNSDVRVKFDRFSCVSQLSSNEHRTLCRTFPQSYRGLSLPLSAAPPSTNGHCAVVSQNHFDVEDSAAKCSVHGNASSSGHERVTCAKCLRTFNRLADLHVHMQCHTGEMRYNCGVCGRPFRKSGTLSRHMRVHSGERPYVCETCGKSYKLLFHLRLHNAVHSADRPHGCEICAKTFQSASSLKKHRFVHSGVKPWSCPVCRKSFNRGGNMRAHMRVHGGSSLAASHERACILCRKTFGDPSSLQAHLQTHAYQMELDVSNTLTTASSLVSPAPPELTHCRVEREHQPDDVYVAFPAVHFDDFDVD